VVARDNFHSSAGGFCQGKDAADGADPRGFPRSRTATGPKAIMTATNLTQPRRPLRREAATHLFAVGQAVRLRGGWGTYPKIAEIYRITGTLPARGDSAQYRIRSEAERHERVTTQDTLEAVLMSPAGENATLIERTFGHGQGTEAQQSRDQKAEAGKGAA